MKTVNAQTITETIAHLCIDANRNLPKDVAAALHQAEETEPFAPAKDLLSLLTKNEQIARTTQMPICQDTGMAVVFADVGQDVHIAGDFAEAVNEGVRRGYVEGLLRKSVVGDPLRRVNTGDNTPAVLHTRLVPGDTLTLTVAPKGFGSENMSQLRMLTPASGIDGVKRFVLISTDKAVNPTNVMGASKRMAEIIIEAMQKQSSTTQFTAVRFGNVLGSNGSVVPLFERQIRAGGPVTLTHPDIIRYFMTIPEAASLVLQAASIARGGELFVLDMGKPVKIRELAERMIQLYSDPLKPPVEIVYTGLRPGEKLYEELLRDEETDTATSKEKIFIAKPEQVEWADVENMLRTLHECLDNHGDIKACMHRLLPSFKTPEEVNGRV